MTSTKNDTDGSNVVKNIVDDLSDNQVGSKISQYISGKKWDELNVLLDTQLPNKKRNWNYIFNKYKPGERNQSLFIRAIECGVPLETLSTIVKNGANPSAIDPACQENGLYRAIRKEKWSTLKHLLRLGGNPNVMIPKTEKTIFDTLVLQFNLDMVLFILELELDVDKDSYKDFDFSGCKRIAYDWNKCINNSRLVRHIFLKSVASVDRLDLSDVSSDEMVNKQRLFEYLLQFQSKKNYDTPLMIYERDMQILAEYYRRHRFDKEIHNPSQHDKTSFDSLTDEKRDKLLARSNYILQFINIVEKYAINSRSNYNYNSYNIKHLETLTKVLKWHEIGLVFIRCMKKDNEKDFDKFLQGLDDKEGMYKKFNRYGDRNYVDKIDIDFILNEYNSWKRVEQNDTNICAQDPILTHAVIQDFPFGIKKLIALGVCFCFYLCFYLFLFLYVFSGVDQLQPGLFLWCCWLFVCLFVYFFVFKTMKGQSQHCG